MADISTQNGAMLIQSDSTSEAAKSLWKKFGSNPHVEVINVPDGKAANGKRYNIAPNGIALKGKGTIGLDGAIERDKELLDERGTAWHDKTIFGAMTKLKTAMDRLYD